MRSNHHTKTALAITLALSAIAAPAAYAQGPVVQPNPDQQTATAAQATPAALSQTAPVVRPNPDQQTAGREVGPPILPVPTRAERAAIKQAERLSAQPRVYNQPDGSTYSNADINAYANDGSLTTPHSVVRVAAPNSGFDWGDAGIGAAGGFALSMLGLGSALVLSQRRARRSSPSAALTG